MGELCKRTEEWRVNDEAEAKLLLKRQKQMKLSRGMNSSPTRWLKKIKSLRAKLSTNGLSSHSLNNGKGTGSNG